MVNTKRFMGYDKNEYGQLIYNYEEARILQSISDLFRKGLVHSKQLQSLTKRESSR